MYQSRLASPLCFCSAFHRATSKCLTETNSGTHVQTMLDILDHCHWIGGEHGVKQSVES